MGATIDIAKNEILRDLVRDGQASIVPVRILGRHSLQIEINRRLYMDEVSLARTAGFGALQADLVRLIEALADYVRARA